MSSGETPGGTTELRVPSETLHRTESTNRPTQAWEDPTTEQSMQTQTSGTKSNPLWEHWKNFPIWGSMCRNRCSSGKTNMKKKEPLQVSKVPRRQDKTLWTTTSERKKNSSRCWRSSLRMSQTPAMQAIFTDCWRRSGPRSLTLTRSAQRYHPDRKKE